MMATPTQLVVTKPRAWMLTMAPGAGGVAVVVASVTFMNCTVCPGPNSIPVVSGNTVVVRGGTHSGPVMVESLWVIVPASVDVVLGMTVVTGVVLIGVVVDDVGVGVVVVPVPVAVVVVPVAVGVVPVAVGVVPVVDVVPVGVVVPVTAAVPPAREMATPHVAVSPVLVTRTSVKTSVCAAGTVNAVTAVVPAGTARVISTRLSTTGAVVVVDALGVSVDVVVAVVVGDTVVVVVGLVVGGVESGSGAVSEARGSSAVPEVVVCAVSCAAETPATTIDRLTASRIASFMKNLLEGTGPAARNAGATDLSEVSADGRSVLPPWARPFERRRDA